MKDDRFEELLREAVTDSCNGMLDSLPEPEELEGLSFHQSSMQKCIDLLRGWGGKSGSSGDLFTPPLYSLFS